MNLLILAKEPVAGRVKTRLCPPCTPQQAADLAAAALADTLAAACAAASFDRVVVAFDGTAGGWIDRSVEVVAQVPGAFDRRLAAAWASMHGPTLQIGMDTPQVTPSLLDRCGHLLLAKGTDAVLGPAEDGGWWALGLRTPRDVFTGVPMSTASTGRAQRDRLEALGLTVRPLPVLRDVDHVSDALAVAGDASRTRFAHALRTAGVLAEAS